MNICHISRHFGIILTLLNKAMEIVVESIYDEEEVTSINFREEEVPFIVQFRRYLVKNGLYTNFYLCRALTRPNNGDTVLIGRH